MEYSEFVSAVIEDDEPKINILYKRIFGVLTRYVMVRTGTDIQDAEDAAQIAIMKTISSIKEGNITAEDKIISYMMTAAWNERVRKIQKEKKYLLDDQLGEQLKETDTGFHQLIEKDKKKALEECLDTLTEEHHNYISYFFEFPGVDAETVAKRFKMSNSNVWVKKHRIVKLLRDCVFTKI